MKVCFVIPNFNFFKTHRADLIKELTAHYEMHVITDISLASKQEINEFSKQNIKIHHVQARNGSMSFKPYFQYFVAYKRACSHGDAVELSSFLFASSNPLR